jgi:uncharacterized membrane protein YjjP (DUF1212 family)
MVNLPTAIERLDEIKRSDKTFSVVWLLLANIVVSAAISRKGRESVVNQSHSYLFFVVVFVSLFLSLLALFFGGNWADSLLSGGLGFLVAVIQQLAARRKHPMHVIELVCAILVSFLASLVASFTGNYVCFVAVGLSSLVSMMPGYAITTAVLELSMKHVTIGMCML